MTQQLSLRCRARLRRDVRRQSGAVLVVALVSMLVVMMIMSAMLQGTLRVRRHLRAQRDLRQTEFLLQAGADRAAFRLTNATDYRGETWNLPADEMVGNGEGRVTIVASRDSDARPWEVHVVAEYPTGSESSIRRSRTFFVQSQPSLAQE
jgi:Tfp pilus assembly protein PilX